MTQRTTSNRQLRLAALLVAIGLVIQSISLLWAGPSAFLVFILLGAATAGVGIILAAIGMWHKSHEVSTGN